ncbi:MAG: hypothetical protein IJI84_05780 [Clostridia bacterium]|nr:hypothetical protein [Clostridia bacterium]
MKKHIKKTFAFMLTIFLMFTGMLFTQNNELHVDALSNKKSSRKVNKHDGTSKIFYSKFVTTISKIANVVGRIFGGKVNTKKPTNIDTSFTSCWMKYLKDDAKLKDILIPGSHDSGTYSMAPTTGLNLIGKAVQIQEMDIYNQAKVGARCFNIRARALSDSVVISHDIVNGCKVSDVLKSFLNFIKDNPSEVIILHITHSSSIAIKKIIELPEMKSIFEKSLTKSMCSNYGLDYPLLSMKQLRDSKVNFVIISDYNDEHFHETWNLHDIYTEKTRESNSTDIMVNQELKNLSDAPSYKMVNITPIHTSTTKEFFLNKASPLAWENKISKYRNEKLLASDLFRKKANIVSLDALYHNAKFVKTIIDINKERYLMN